MNQPKEILVLFSGGRDSSAKAIQMTKLGFQVNLFTYQAGLPELTGEQGDSAPNIRHKELFNAFPESINKNRIIEGNTYLIRKLAIEKTNETHVVYPVALTLAVHSQAIIYCLENGIKNIACGYSGYQSCENRYIEQRDDFFQLMKSFVNDYGIEYHAPVIKKSKNEVLDILEKNGISSNSLENKSLFGAIPFDVAKAYDFWNESLPICRDYIDYHLKLNK